MKQKALIFASLLFLQPSICQATNTDSAIELYNNQDYHGAFNQFKAIADDDPIAAYYLANMYAGGQGTDPDMEKALTFFIQSAEQGHAKAQFKTGLAYSEGYGTKKDSSTAFTWFEKAAEQAVPQAQFYVAVAYLQGNVVEKNLISAAKWMKLAAKQGVPEAQSNLGDFYSKGIGVRPDNELAFAWFSIATLSGNEQAEQSQQLLVTKMSPEEVQAGEALAQKIYTKMMGANKK